MRSISINCLENLAQALASEFSPAYVYNDGQYVGIVWKTSLICPDKLRLISRRLRGLHWFIERYSQDWECFFISFNSSYLV